MPPRPAHTLAILALLLLSASGCGPHAGGLTAQQAAVHEALSPILQLDPDANWTECFNRALSASSTDVVGYLISRPAMSEVAAPDSLATLAHASMLRLIVAEPGAPRLTLNCFETTFELLHFDPKAHGKPLGTVWLAPDARPRAWHDCYPTDIDRSVAESIDAEADRLAVLAWVRAAKAGGGRLRLSAPLAPRPENALRVLSRRMADRWSYELKRRSQLVADGPRAPAQSLLERDAADYNLVRSACIWLGSSADRAVETRLIELIGSPSEIESHNALFALRFSRDQRVREAVQRRNP